MRTRLAVAAMLVIAAVSCTKATPFDPIADCPPVDTLAFQAGEQTVAARHPACDGPRIKTKVER